MSDYKCHFKLSELLTQNYLMQLDGRDYIYHILWKCDKKLKETKMYAEPRTLGENRW